MKSRLVPILLACASASLARADFNPVPLTPGSFTADVIVEKNAAPTINDFVTATMDGGTNNNGSTFYEQGYASPWPWTGVPAAGSTFSSITDPTGHQFKMPPSYTTNNAILIGNYAGFTTGNLRISAPTSLTSLSLLASAGNGPAVLNYTIQYAGGGTQPGSVSVDDWTGGTTIAWYANARVSLDDGTIASIAYTNGTNRRLLYYDIPLTDTVNAVTNIQFSYVSGGRAAIFGLSGTTGANFTPLDVTGFDKDMIIEKTVLPEGFSLGANVSMDNGGAINTGNGWYEQGFNRGALATGVPTNNTSFTVGDHTFRMAPDYTTSNAFFVSANPGLTAATASLSAPASYTALSFLASAGNGPCGVTVTVHHSSDPDEVFTISVLDWFNGATATWLANGRYQKETRTFNNVNGGAVKIFTNDVVLVGTSSVTSIDLAYASGGRAVIFAVSGSTGGTFNPIAVTGYNVDAIVERSRPSFENPLSNATTITMDGGTNNNANTWYEAGYYKAQLNTGFPAAGSTINSLAQPDHHYQMPASYSANDTIFVDNAHTTANVTFATPTTYSALSFLSATANGNVTNQAIMQYADGTTETNSFISRDWFGNTPVAFYANGRMSVDNRTINNDPGRAGTPNNPRLYEAQFALGNTGSVVTNVILTYLNPTNSTGRMYVFAVSATAGAVPPIIASVSINPGAAYEGSNVVVNAVITGGTTPITYKWQKGTNGIFVDVSNGGTISGATTTNLVITGAVPGDVADYRLVASNITGPVNSGIATLNRVVSTLQDVTVPTDMITILSGTPSAGVEGVASAIDNTIQKNLIFGANNPAAPFVGPVGFTVKPSKGNTIVSAIRIYTANDSEGRDPADYLLEGSLDGIGYSTISSGPLALPSGRNTTTTDVVNPLVHNLQEVRFANTAGYNYYRVSFNNVKDNVNNTSAQYAEVELLGVINPNPPPIFTTPVADVTANEGTTATFVSLAVGPATLTYQWYDVTAGDPGTLLVGKTNPNLDLTSVTLGQSGNRYRVVATNPYGSTANPATALPGALLTVNSGPVSIVQDLAAQYLFYAGRTESLSIGVAGTSPVYQWQRNGVNLVNGGRISGANSNVLTISNVQLGDVDTYQVISSNVYGGNLTSVASVVPTVFVTAAPNFHTNGLSWQLVNGGANIGYFSAENVLSLTDAGNEQRAAWFTKPMNFDAFQASFVYQDIGGGGADGCGFVIQNSPQGTNALGGGGGGMAYLGMANSVAVTFNIYNQSGIAFGTNGVIGTYGPTAPVNLPGGDPIQVNLSYSGSVLTVTLSNMVSSTTYTTNMVVGSLAAIVGTNVAYVGITAATGGIASQQQVSNFQYIPVPKLSSQSAGSNVQLKWPSSIGGYGLQSSPDLTTPAWSSVAAPVSQTNGQNQATVTPVTGAAFYRLVLPAGTP